MAAVNASVALTTARTLLNDDAGDLYSDAVLLPKLVQAFRQMVAMLRVNAADIMMTIDIRNIAANTPNFTVSDINEPIMLWEKATTDTDDKYVKMTEYDPLPNAVQAATLNYWQWDGTNINFIAASAIRSVKTRYWRVLPEPSSAASSLILINAEYYLAPMMAAIMVGSLGEEDQMNILVTEANSCFKMIIDANRGRQAPPLTSRP